MNAFRHGTHRTHRAVAERFAVFLSFFSIFFCFPTPSSSLSSEKRNSVKLGKKKRERKEEAG